jgi:hypothetical protein
MLNVQKHNSDKSGPGFVNSCSSLPSTSHANSVSEGKTTLVKAVKIEEAKTEVASLDKGKNVCLNDVVKPNSRHPPRKQPTPGFVPTCHH